LIHSNAQALINHPHSSIARRKAKEAGKDLHPCCCLDSQLFYIRKFCSSLDLYLMTIASKQFCAGGTSALGFDGKFRRHHGLSQKEVSTPPKGAARIQQYP
jgi:hypothetical protein